MSDKKAKFEELKQQMAALRKQMEEQTKDFFKEASKELFVKHPNLKSFSWTQYTPYFNDGETCYFSAHTDYIHLTMLAKADAQVPGVEDEEVDDDDEFDNYAVHGKKRKDYTEREAAGIDALELLKIFSEEDYETMFGDHVRVTVSRKGVSVDEYEHD